MWPQLLAKLRTLSMYYQTAHWQCKGSLFYQDHLLFERLYNVVNEEIDGVAERAVGITQDVSVVNLNDSLKLMAEIAIKLPMENKENVSYAQTALILEMDLLKMLGSLEPNVTLGTKDLMGAIANSHESNCYLLRQRISK